MVHRPSLLTNPMPDRIDHQDLNAESTNRADVITTAFKIKNSAVDVDDDPAPDLAREDRAASLKCFGQRDFARNSVELSAV
jgi:hypothetical protein